MRNRLQNMPSLITKEIRTKDIPGSYIYCQSPRTGKRTFNPDDKEAIIKKYAENY